MLAPFRAVGRGLRRVLPTSFKGWAFLIVLVGVLVAGGLVVRDYFTTEANDQANAYRAEITRPMERAAETMDDVYDAFDHYTVSGFITYERVRSADDTAELKRRVIPKVHEITQALREAKKTVADAEKVLIASAKPLDDTPEPPWLLDDDPVYDEITAARRHAQAYLRDSRAYLREFDEFIKYELKNNALSLQSWKDLSEPAPDAGIEQLEAYAAHELAEAERLRKEHLDLKPLPDTRRLYNLSLESINVDIDFLEDFKTAFETLDQALLDTAYADHKNDIRGYRRKFGLAAWEFSAHSKLREKATPLCKQADDIEEEIAAIGEGGKDRTILHRPPVAPEKPVYPGGGDGGNGDGEGSLS